MRRVLFAVILLSSLSSGAWARFGLSDRSPEEDLAVSVSTPSVELPDPSQAFHFDQDLWNRARRALEKGYEPGEEPPPEPSAGAAAQGASPVDQPGFSVDLPYESGLAISGRKLIAVKLTKTRYRSAKRAEELGLQQDTQDFEMRQELQVRIKGKVGPKITVNVDFDDTKEDKRDISVMYQGDKDEVVQEAAFGDIVLSLPSTEFVSYSKQLFGVRTRLKYKGAEFMAIGSRTKGVTETKRFNGNVKSERKDILDTQYIRRRHYDFAFATAPVAGTVKVWRDDRIPFNDNPAVTQPLTVGDFAVAVSTSGNFDLLKEGEDYTLDLTRGIVSFSREAPPNAVLAVDYALAAGGSLAGLGATPGLPKIIKTENDLFLSTDTESGYQREIKTFYSIGQTKILSEDGRGRFILRVIDLNRNDALIPLTDGVTVSTTPLTFPANIDVDYDIGRFNIRPPLRVDDPTLYTPSPAHKFSFLLEYRYRVRTYSVRPNIVFGSERVSLNGRLLTRDLDYFMDYDSGFLTFFDDEEIDETSQIEVTYEYAPFGGQLGETLVGTRTELSLIPGRFFLGSTFLFSFAPRPTFVPDVRSTPKSIKVLEVDGRLTDLRLPFLPLTLSLSGEAAQSRENPNLFGRALVDSMEGLKQETQAIMDVDFWQLGSNRGGGVTRANSLSVGDGELRLEEINPNVPSERKKERQKVLTVGYNNMLTETGAPADPEESSLVQSISRSGLDFSKKVTLELWVEGSVTPADLAAGTDMDLWVDAGQFKEDADSDGFLDTEDKNNDGTLNLGEDTGWGYDDPAFPGSPVSIGANNGRVDSEDLDQDGARDAEFTPRTIPLFRLSDVTASSPIKMTDAGGNDAKSANLNFAGWRFIQVPLDIAPTEEQNFEAVKQVRVTLKRLTAAGPARSGGIRMARISFVGHRWERPSAVAGATMTISAVNNIDNPEYQSRSLLGHPSYDELYKDETGSRTREQTLALNFSLPAGSTVSTRVAYPVAQDFSKHRTLQFFVRVPDTSAVGETLSLQLGSETDYYEYSIPVTPQYRGMWILETIHLTDLNDDSTPDILTPVNGNATVRIVGSPSLTRVGQVKLLLSNPPGGSPIAGEVWVNEIHLTGARKKVGNAQRFDANLVWPGWGSIGGRTREVDRNFQTLTSQVLNQDKRERAADFSFSKLRFLPLSGNINKSETITPAVFRTGEAGLISLLSEGRELSVTGRGDGQLLIPHLPPLGFSYDKAITKSTERRERRDKDTYTGTLEYTVPWKPDVLPGGFWTLRPLPESVFVKYIRTNHFLKFLPALSTYTAVSTFTVTDESAIFSRVPTVEFTDNWSGRASFAPWTGFTLSPTYDWKKVREQRRFSEDEIGRAPRFDPAKNYDKAFSQTYGLSGSWRLIRWLEPRFNFTVSGTETNSLPTVSTPTAFNHKLLDRSANGDAFWTFNFRELLPNFRPGQSFRLDNSFRVESGDSYENVEREFNEWRRIGVLEFKRISRRGGRRMYGLLEPLRPADSLARRKNFTARNTLRSSGDWSPLDWMNFSRHLQPLRTFHLTATITNTDEHTDTYDTARDVSTVIWPDLILSLRDTERFWRLERWMNNSQINFRSNRKKTETFGEDFTRSDSMNTDYRFSLFEKYDVFMSYGLSSQSSRDLRSQTLKSEGEGYSHSLQVGMKLGSWRYTPRADFKGDESRDSLGKLSQDLQTQTYSLLMYLDKSYPQGFRIPFTKKVFGNVNRLRVDAKTTFERKESSLDVERNNTDVYSADVTGEWEIARNFRLSFGGGGSWTENRVKKDFGFYTLQVNSQLVIQF